MSFMAKTQTPKNHRMPWTTQNDRELRQLVKEKMTAVTIAKKVGRSAAAVQQRLMTSGISLRAAKKVKARAGRTA